MVAIPVRLLLGKGESTMDLFVTTMDMTINRNTAQYPTPDLMAGRVGIDTNTPEIKIELQGILSDDDIALAGDISTASGTVRPLVTSEPRSNLVTAINFNSILAHSHAYESEITEVPHLGETQWSLVSSNSWFGVPAGFAVTPMEIGAGLYGKFTVNQGYFQGTTAVIETTKSNFRNGEEDEVILAKDASVDGWLSSQNSVNYGLGYSSSDTVIRVQPASTLHSTFNITGKEQALRPSNSFKAGDRIVNSSGTYIGTVASTSDSLDDDGAVDNPANNTITFASPGIAIALSDDTTLYKQLSVFGPKGVRVGYLKKITKLEFAGPSAVNSGHAWEIELESVASVTLREGDALYLNQLVPIEDRLHEQVIKLTPSYWVQDVQKSCAGMDVEEDDEMISRAGVQGVLLRFDASVDISTQASRVSKVTSPFGSPGDIDYNNGDGEIKIPIKGINDKTNPASELAQKIVDSINHFSQTGSSYQMIEEPTVNGIVEAGPDDPSFAPNAIRQTAYWGNIGYANDGIYIHKFITAERHGNVLLLRQVYVPDVEISMPNTLSKELGGIGLEAITTTNYLVGGAGANSAGDKVQNLMAMVSNASKNVDLIRGIQIPYDSLITSSSVNGTARNFFLTFGQVDRDDKGSINNFRAASEEMDTFDFNSMMVGGFQPHPRGESLLEWIGDFGDGPVGSIMNFLVNAIDVVWTTLTTDPHGNLGGINVIPNKLHVRYDAGNKYYAFNLELLASDFIIGV